MINNIRFFCQRVLPVVYDDSLSYQELLYKVVHKINEVIGITNDLEGEIITEIDKILNEWLDDGTLELIINEEIFQDLKCFYIPEDFGGVGDGSTDCTEAFDKACKAMATSNIKQLFIPAGKTYLIKNTIAIPENCRLFGAGAASVIYYDETNTSMGVGITNGGDNVIIENLSINHKSKGTVTMSSQPGAVGLSTYKTVGEMNMPVDTYNKGNTNNVYIRNLFCDGQYALQTEPLGDYTINNVVCENIYAPIGLVSFISRNNLIKNLVYRNVVCDTIRAGGTNAPEIVDMAVIDGFKCKFVRLYAVGTHMINGYIDCNSSNNNDGGYAVMMRPQTTLENIKIVGGNEQFTAPFALMGDASHTGKYSMINVRATDFERSFVNSGGLEKPHAVDLVNCHIDWNGDYRPTIQGTIRGGWIKVFNPISALYIEDVVETVTSEYLEWTTDSVSVRYRKSATIIGNILHLQALNFLSGLPENGSIFNLASIIRNRLGRNNYQIPITLLKSDGTKTMNTTALLNEGTCVIQTAGINLSDYDYYEINTDIPLVSIYNYI